MPSAMVLLSLLILSVIFTLTISDLIVTKYDMCKNGKENKTPYKIYTKLTIIDKKTIIDLNATLSKFYGDESVSCFKII